MFFNVIFLLLFKCHLKYYLKCYLKYYYQTIEKERNFSILHKVRIRIMFIKKSVKDSTHGPILIIRSMKKTLNRILANRTHQLQYYQVESTQKQNNLH